MISIILPVYNVEKYLGKCLDSILNQTYKDFELIIVNDGSTDKSEDIIKEYLPIMNIRYIIQNNEGLSFARNVGIEHAAGSYLYIMDSDDYIEDRTLELLLKAIEEDNSDVAICNFNVIDEATCDKKMVKHGLDGVHSGLEVAVKMLECKVNGVTWNKLIRNKMQTARELEFEYGRYTQDWYPIFKLIYSSNKVCFVDEPLYNYRKTSTSTTSKRNLKRLIDYTYAVNMIYNYSMKEVEIPNRVIRKFKARTFHDSFTMYYCLKHKNGFKVYKDFIGSGVLDFEIDYRDVFYALYTNYKVFIKLVLYKLKMWHIFKINI